MADVAEPDREASNSAAVDSLERPNDENGENNTAKEQSESPIDNKAQSPVENRSPKEEKANDADDDVVMEGTKEEETHQPSNGTPASKKSSKRKSSSAIPEHKTKKLNRKKSTKDLQLRLDVEPGQYWFARMKGYPPWPCIICDEEMLPETLLKTRPVSAKRLDGSYREDFTEGGKNARDRTYPVMFLGTNEFAWQVNTALEPLDVEKIKEETPEKKTKAHWEAYKVAMEESDLQHFKDMLAEHESALKQDRKEKAEREAKKNSKKDNSRRKSKDKAIEEDYDMDDDEGEGDQKAKGNKKRKKDPESDGEPLKSTKTPKTKLKVNGPKPLQEEPSSKKKEKSAKSRASTSKAKGADDEDIDEAQAGDKPLTESEIQEKRKKTVLYLRHKLQKGFLSRDQAPIEAEMTAMSGHFENLEKHANLEAPIIRTTKINKVLKGIVKLNSIPKDEEFNFKKRSTELLSQWNKVLNAEEGPSAGGDSMNTNEKHDSTMNGVTHEKASEDQKTGDEQNDKTKDVDMKEGQEDKNDVETNGHGKEDAAKVGTVNGDDSADMKEAEKPVDEEEDQNEKAGTAEASAKEGETAEEKKETAESAEGVETATATTGEKGTEMET